jgi:hypothetical protein
LADDLRGKCFVGTFKFHRVYSAIHQHKLQEKFLVRIATTAWDGAVRPKEGIDVLLANNAEMGIFAKPEVVELMKRMLES